MNRITILFTRMIAIMALVLPMAALAFDGDMDEYHEFKEDLALARDSYITALNVAMEDNGKSTLTWAEMEYEAPELQYTTMKEVPGGFRVAGKHGAYTLDVEVRVSPSENDFRYEVKYLKGTNKPGKEIAGEVFR